LAARRFSPSHSTLGAFRYAKLAQLRGRKIGGAQVFAFAFVLISGTQQRTNSFEPSGKVRFPQAFRSIALPPAPVTWLPAACSPPAGGFRLELRETRELLVIVVPCSLQFFSLRCSCTVPRRSRQLAVHASNFTSFFVSNRNAAAVSSWRRQPEEAPRFHRLGDSAACALIVQHLCRCSPSRACAG
jgi:hypothetical protein